jgi:hypothetical protein
VPFFTVVRSSNPSVVTKRITLNDDAQLLIKPVANIVEATCQAVQIDSLADLSHQLKVRKQNECHVYGLPKGDRSGGIFDLVTEKALASRERRETLISRSRENFSWPQGAGVLMLDYDAPKDGTAPLSREELLQALYTVAPELVRHQLLWTPSTSSCIYQNERELRGVKGQRLYILLTEASKIPDVGAGLNELLWAAGFGRHEISKSGQILERPIFDASVWSTNHIDFCGGAICADGLDQRRGNPVLLGGAEPIWAATGALSLKPETRVQAGKNKEASIARIYEQAREAKERWKEAQRVKYLRILRDFDDLAVRDFVHRAIEHSELPCHWRVVVIENEKELEVPVQELIANPDRYDCALTLDPIEPDYDGRRLVGKLYLTGGQQNLYSFAHGGANYRLVGEAKPIEIIEGKEAQVVDATLEVLRKNPDLYDFGDTPVEVQPDGRLYPLKENALKYILGKSVQFKSGAKLRNPPPSVCKTLLEIPRGLKRLDAVITAPTLRSDGSVVNSPGYDPISKLLLIGQQTYAVPINPTDETAKGALEVLMKPFAEFPFVDNLAWSVHLGALLTAAIRPSVPTAPAFVYDAPTQGSGKSLLAACVGMLATGKTPPVWPHVNIQNTDETRKRMFTALKDSERVVVWDNVVGAFDSAPLAAILTSPSAKDRLLNTQTSIEVPNRVLLLLTGNNFTPAGDMARRVFICRIDPKTEMPCARRFSDNPLEICKYNRQEMIGAALTLIRYYLSSGASRDGDTGSFSEWDLFVRQTIIYLGKTIARERCVDIMKSIEQNSQQDPEAELLSALYQSWLEIFGHEWKTAKEVANPSVDWDWQTDGPRNAFRESLVDLVKGPISIPTVSRALRYRKGRVVDDLVLEEGKNLKQNVKTWRIIKNVSPGKTEKSE